MKWSTRILLTIVLAFVGGLLISNIVLKKEYDKIDKSDLHWNYEKVLGQHFKYLKIEGGNITNIAFEQSTNCSVRILNDWQRNKPPLINTFVKNDTLFVKFISKGKNENEKNWMEWTTLVRIFSPELLYVEGFNTKFEMFNVKQKSISVNMSGKSEFELESMATAFDSLEIVQKDSSAVVFEMSPDYKTTASFHVKKVNAAITGVSILDLGHAQIDSLQLNIADSSGIILSGGALKKRVR
jgi:Putative auto-transporter adhesin, head GIN domain